MWRKEREIWQEEDERLKKKIRDINQATQAFLKEQEDQKKTKNKKMGPTDKAFNKGLMREIKEKQRQMREQ